MLIVISTDRRERRNLPGSPCRSLGFEQFSAPPPVHSPDWVRFLLCPLSGRVCFLLRLFFGRGHIRCRLRPLDCHFDRPEGAEKSARSALQDPLLRAISCSTSVHSPDGVRFLLRLISGRVCIRCRLRTSFWRDCFLLRLFFGRDRIRCASVRLIVISTSRRERRNLSGSPCRSLGYGQFSAPPPSIPLAGFAFCSVCSPGGSAFAFGHATRHKSPTIKTGPERTPSSVQCINSQWYVFLVMCGRPGR